MTIFSKPLAPAGLALAALVALPVNAQVEGRLATVDVTRTIINTNAFKAAYDQVTQSFSIQADLRIKKAEELETLVAKFDKNKDNKLDDAEGAAMKKSTDYPRIQTLEQEIIAIGNQIDSARIYAIQQIVLQYGMAVEDVVNAQKIKMVVDPTTLLFYVPEADISDAVTTALNARVTAVNIVPPAGWQPTRDIVQIYKEIQQRLIASQIAQQQQAAAAAAAGTQPGNPEAPVGR